MTKKQGGKTIQEEIEVLKSKENTKVPKNTSEEKQTFGNYFLRSLNSDSSIIINYGAKKDKRKKPPIPEPVKNVTGNE